MNIEEICGFPRENYASDSEWIQAAIDENPGKEVFIPAGVYKIDKTLNVYNGASVRMDKGAILLAACEMDYVLNYDSPGYTYPVSDEIGRDVLDFNRYVIGGTIDGAGLASCMSLEDYRHFTLRDTAFLNGKKHGLRVGRGVELIASNLYFKCNISGLAGNTAVYAIGGDNHYTDIVVVDYTVGFDISKDGHGANRLTRCHVWGGPLPPLAEGEDCEMLVNSVGFRLDAWDTLLRDCYADTNKIGFDVYNAVRLLGCSYYNNFAFKLNDTTVIRKNTDEQMIVDGCLFIKVERSTLFEGNKENVVWNNNILREGFENPMK